MGKFTSQGIALICVVVLVVAVFLAACSPELAAPETPLPLAWQAATTHVISRPAVSDDSVYFINEFGTLTALDIADGTEQFKIDLVDSDHNDRPVGVDGGYVFASAYGDEGKAFAFDARTGEEQWEILFGSYHNGEHPLAHDGVVYFEATGPEDAPTSLRAVDATTGDEIWDFPVGSHIVTSPIIGSDVIYIGAYEYDDSSTKTRFVHAIDMATGEARRTYQSDLDLRAKFALDDTNLYFGVDGGVVLARDAVTGGPGWTARVEDLLSNSPSTADGLVYIGNKKGEMIALNAADGAHLWSLDVGSPVLTQATVTDGVAYFGTNDGYLHAVDAETGAEMWKVQSPLRENVLIQDFVPAMATTPVVADDLLLYFNGESLNALKLR